MTALHISGVGGQVNRPSTKSEYICSIIIHYTIATALPVVCTSTNTAVIDITLTSHYLTHSISYLFVRHTYVLPDLKATIS